MGDRVPYLQEGVHGSYAEYTPVNANRLMPVPDELPLELACAVAVQGIIDNIMLLTTAMFRNLNRALLVSELNYSASF